MVYTACCALHVACVAWCAWCVQRTWSNSAADAAEHERNVPVRARACVCTRLAEGVPATVACERWQGTHRLWGTRACKPEVHLPAQMRSRPRERASERRLLAQGRQEGAAYEGNTAHHNAAPHETFATSQWAAVAGRRRAVRAQSGRGRYVLGCGG